MVLPSGDQTGNAPGPAPGSAITPEGGGVRLPGSRLAAAAPLAAPPLSASLREEPPRTICRPSGDQSSARAPEPRQRRAARKSAGSRDENRMEVDPSFRSNA